MGFGLTDLLRSLSLPNIQNSSPVQENKYNKFQPYSIDQLRLLVDRNNKQCPFYGKVGQNSVIEQLLAILVEAWKNEFHSLPKSTALMFTGPASTGKTEFAKLLGGPKGLNTPFVETDARQIKSVQDIFNLSRNVLTEFKIPFNEIGKSGGRSKYIFPPITIFIDEIHGLSPSVMDALLKALESNDAMLITESVIVDCSKVLWIGATTERGAILLKKPPFDSRFDKIEFKSYTKAEVSQIIHNNFGWDKKECDALTVRSGGIVREALAIGRKVKRQQSLMSLTKDNISILDAITKVSEQLGIDEEGLSYRQIAVLKALKQKYPKGINYPQLARILNSSVVELKEAVLPGLMLSTEDHPPLITWAGQTFITTDGLQVLEKRKL